MTTDRRTLADSGSAPTDSRPVLRDAEAQTAGRNRNAALDFTKGALVLLMVVYHCLNYFYHDRTVLKYLHFLPPSFIFITGFLITTVYLTRAGAGDSRVYRRLFVRGGKLLLIFVGLNLVVHSLFSANYNRRPMGLSFFFDHLYSIFFTGEERASVFEVLLPISYLLLLSGALLRGCRIHRSFLPIVTGGLLALCLVLAAQGNLVFNLELLSMGLLGMVVGLVPLQRIDGLADHRVPVSVAYLAYVAVISRWYPVYALNIIGICLTLLLLYGAGVKLGAQGVVQRRIILLGKYSLLAYIVQIGVLQTLFRGLRHLALGEGNLAAGLIVTSVLTVAIIESVDRLRTRSAVLDRSYKMLFA